MEPLETQTQEQPITPQVKLNFNPQTGDFSFEGSEASLPDLTYTIDSMLDRIEGGARRSYVEYRKENMTIVGLSVACTFLVGATVTLALTTVSGAK